jgi:hypothetical protein
MQTLRTPDDRFADTPEFAYVPRYCEVPDDDGGSLRMAWAGEQLAGHIVDFLRSRATASS